MGWAKSKALDVTLLCLWSIVGAAMGLSFLISKLDLMMVQAPSGSFLYSEIQDKTTSRSSVAYSLIVAWTKSWVLYVCNAQCFYFELSLKGNPLHAGRKSRSHLQVTQVTYVCRAHVTRKHRVLGNFWLPNSGPNPNHIPAARQTFIVLPLRSIYRKAHFLFVHFYTADSGHGSGKGSQEPICQCLAESKAETVAFCVGPLC